MERVTCPDCEKTYINYYVYRKHAKRKHGTYFEPKKTGPKRVFMPNASESVRKKAMYKKSMEKNGKKRNYKQRQLRLANQVVKHQNQSDDDLLAQLAETSQMIIDEYIRTDDDITLQLAGYRLLDLHWDFHADISLLWPHGHGALSLDPPERFFNKKSKSGLKSNSQSQRKAAEKRRRATAIRKYHEYINNAISTLLEAFTNTNGREKRHVRKYRILSQRYLLRHQECLSDIARIPVNIIAEARKKNAHGQSSGASATQINNDGDDYIDNQGCNVNNNNDSSDDDYGDDYIDNQDCNVNNNDRSDDDFGGNAYAANTITAQQVITC